MKTKLLCIAGVAAGLLAGAAPAVAHHSGAMFDSTKKVVLKGTVKELQWTNPHMWLEVMVPDPKTGKAVQWGFEMIGPNVMAREGWTRNTVRAGDVVTVTGNPLKDGRPGAGYRSIVLANGKVLTRGEKAPPTDGRAPG